MLSRRSVLKSAGGLALAVAAAEFGGVSDKWERLRQQLTGTVVRPGDTDYQFAKTVFLGEPSARRPQAVAYCRTAPDVQRCVDFARTNDIELHTRSSGHNLAGWSTGEGLVLDVSNIDQTWVTDSTVHLGPGAMSIEAITALAPSGRQIVTGTCPTVCPGGFISGGGIGLQTRKYGTGSDRLVSATVALADGRVVQASENSEADLFWALRGGGGGNFGIVLDFEVVPIPQPRGIYFSTVWNWDDAAAVAAAWQEWSVAASHDLGSLLLVITPDAAPGNVPTVLLSGAYWGPQAELENGLQQLAAQARAQPVSTIVQELSYDGVMREVYGCGQLTADQCHLVGQTPNATIARPGLLRERPRIFDRPVTGSRLDAALAAYDSDRRAGEARYLSFTATGGRANEISRTATAYCHRSAQFIIGFAAATPDPAPPAEVVEAMTRWVGRGFDLLDPVSTGESYINFPDPFLADWQSAYYGENYARLLDVKRRYDPGKLFHHPQSVGT